MSPVRPRRRSIRLIAVAGAVILTSGTLTLSGASGAGPRTPPPGGGRPPSSEFRVADGTDVRGAAKALSDHAGISRSAARERIAGEQQLARTARRLAQVLKGRSGGSYIDENGTLVVTVVGALPPDLAAPERAGNPDAVRFEAVTFTSRDLRLATRRLNRFAATTRTTAVESWGPDVPSNTISITRFKGRKAGAFLRFARAGRVPVTVTRTVGRTSSAAYNLWGGQKFEWSPGGYCSVGFNVRSASNRAYVLTAGHCTKGSSREWRLGRWLGTPIFADYPGNDYGLFRNDYPGFWIPRGGVYMFDNWVKPVKGWSNPPVGSTVCKSGATTGWTCGVIQGYNRTVLYDNQHWMYGLVQHNACVEGGDSGGSNITPSGYAVGVTSGARTYRSGSRNVCGVRIGQQNVSWYQPVSEALGAYGVRLQLWPS